MVEWDIAPHWFGHVDSNGDIVINREGVTLDGGDGDTGDGDTGGGSTDDGSNGGGSTGGGSTGGGSTGGGSTGGGSTGGSSSGGGSTGGGSSGGGSGDGGSTVPEFDLDESAIIAAIESAGRANQNAIRALSNDTMGKIDQQTDTLNAATTAQTNALNSSLAAQTDTVNSALDSQTNTLNQTLDNRTDNLSRQLDDQNTRFSAAFDSLGNTVTDAIDRFEADGENSGGDGDGEGLLDAIPGLLDSLVDNLAGRFTEQVGEGDDLLNTTGMDTALDRLNDQETQYGEDVKTLMDEIGDGATSSIADQITSRLPSLPSGGCVPLQFGPMEISCQAFNTIKLWLTWIIYFWTVVSIVDTFFRSEQRTA
ncbi:hypothetical protein [Vreelandella zhanjiangensis]|uniref:hypothetical protein n=1 Tax=Vreelandella zhanjiangensis TaxID=1121960 RepID=UPI00036E0F20|nr:hypothetical protein [Halomonas zhanjiangensis]